jgi:hypothetical protein
MSCFGIKSCFVREEILLQPMEWPSMTGIIPYGPCNHWYILITGHIYVIIQKAALN